MVLKLKKWSLRIFASSIVLAGLFLFIFLNPGLLYAHKTKTASFIIYHNNAFDPQLLERLENVNKIIRESEYYDSTLTIQICLNDGSFYPPLLETIRGPAFAWGFQNKVVLQGKTDVLNNQLEFNGYNWNLEHLIAHEIVHCLQFNKLGFWDSNPLANYPQWKWEGYPEYISRQNPEQQNIQQNYSRLIEQVNFQKDTWSISFMDATIAPIDYYKDWLLVKYCLDIKHLSYSELLADETEKEIIEKEMIAYLKKLQPKPKS